MRDSSALLTLPPPPSTRDAEAIETRAEIVPKIGECARLFGSKLRKKLVVCGELAFPEIALDTHHLTEALGAKLEPAPIEIAVFRLHANRRLHASRAAVATVDD